MRISTRFLNAWLCPLGSPREKSFKFVSLDVSVLSLQVCLGTVWVGRYVPESVYRMGQERQCACGSMCVHGCVCFRECNNGG